MTRDQELWGGAHAILARYGAAAGDHIDQRVAALAAAGEAAGVDMWWEVAQRIAALRQPPGRA